MERAGGARVLLEGEFTEESFLEEIVSLLRDTDRLREMGKAMESLSVRDALEQITEAVLRCAGSRDRDKN